MRSPYSRLAASVLLALLCKLLSACAFIPGLSPDSRQPDPPGIHHNEAGDYFAFYPVPLGETSIAARSALQRLGMEYDPETTSTPSRIVIEGMSTNHYFVQVTLEPVRQGQTKAIIHANYYGEKTLSLRFQHLLAEVL